MDAQVTCTFRSLRLSARHLRECPTMSNEVMTKLVEQMFLFVGLVKNVENIVGREDS